ncbi:hypothetical protein [Leekyejoonella antrihumi]|uniref:hypothetical protein n=1 Tax=Leekyejoonella antrihumi TaxID=1660198 RepID=UPI0016467D45|nr:hypothetical protein [Leekyejoonella antrihumi]
MTISTAAAQRRTTYREVLAVREFRVLFTGTALRALAATAEILGLSVLVYARTGSAFLSAIAYGIGFLPQLVGGALLTSPADRLRPRGVLCVTCGESLIVAYIGASGRPASTAGILLIAMPVGMLAGEIAVGRLCSPPARERLCFPMAALMGLPLIAFALQIPIPVGAALLATTGTGFGYQQRFLDTLATRLQDQAFGLRTTGLMGGQGLGPAAAGGFAAALGPGAAIAATGAATALAGLWLRDTLTGCHKYPPAPPGSPTV